MDSAEELEEKMRERKEHQETDNPTSKVLGSGQAMILDNTSFIR